LLALGVLAGCGNSQASMDALGTSAKSYCACTTKVAEDGEALLQAGVTSRVKSECGDQKEAFDSALREIKYKDDEGVKSIKGSVSACYETVKEAHKALLSARR